MAKFLHLIKVMLVTGFVTGIFQNLNAQQVLKRIETGENNELIVSFYACANGTNNTNIIGTNSFDEGSSEYRGVALIYIEATGEILEQLESSDVIYIERENEIISNSTLIYPYSSSTVDWFLTNDDENITLELPQEMNFGYINSISNVAFDQYIVPNALNDGSPIPDGIWVILMSRDLSLLPNGDLWAHRIGWRHNGENWIPQTHDPFGETFDVLQNADLAIFSVALTPNPAEGGSISGNGDYQEGSFATISATANEDFQFVHWKNADTGNVFSTQNPYEFQVLENLNIQAVFQNNMSVNDTETTKSKVFPNPFRDFISIQIAQGAIRKAELFDVSGKLVLSEKTKTADEFRLETQNLPQGIYILKLTTSKGLESHKLVKN